MRDPVTLTPVIETVSFSGDGGDLLQVLDDLDPLLLDSGGREEGGMTVAGVLPRRIISLQVDGDRGNALEVVREHLSRHVVERHPRWPFLGGLMGWFGYDLRLEIEALPDRHSKAVGLPDLHLGDYRLCALLDEGAGVAAVVHLEEPGDDDGNRFLAIAARELVRRLDSCTSPGTVPPAPARSAGEVTFPSRQAWNRMVREALVHIGRGDIYQVNLSQRFEAPRPANLIRFYRRLRAANPAAFGGFVPFGEEALLCISPERFLLLDGREVETRPIKGTAPRDPDPARDDLVAGELQASEKNRAELAMIVDVLRNDLSRVCEVGSVEVLKAIGLESHPTVHHLSACIRGRLEQDQGTVDLLRATFPGGSITGAPKIRAMEIIDALESSRRGPYTGSMGYLGYDGRMDLNIMIRTAVTHRDRLIFHGGGGIVADSDPDDEYDETVHKVRSFLRVLGVPDS